MSFPHSTAAAARLDVVASTGSTNADLRAHAGDAEGWPHLSAILTEDQVAGRGRLDRIWTAPAGSALALSVLLRVPRVPLAERGWIPLAAGLAMADAIAAQLPERSVGVKWPNDVLVGDRKICGILAETTGADVVIVGSGVNTAMTAEQLPVETATSFAVEGGQADLDLLVAGYLARLDGWIEALSEHGSAVASGLRDAVAARCDTLGRTVRVMLPGGAELIGEATGLGADGCLIVSADGTEHRIAAGDIVHLRLA
ncbi:biotin--[acetyl-CoA-carboxylase] ligase [Microbacterium sp.]|uniref:biotin--[acetyl-CoA-carboxylase] ligase n=1 Tax=Microbacterium sp. TaxID=51671 RepID=UPI001AC444E6|nr:biotin--[acetyl-CoA-carboxylase] ligase [Microbacterium sp.]MBN9156399.1 biotin--[acetyl-CoA-carboxylase] ligase [Microbacterium sp.]MBS1899083.1 biotin--[acetyl-CoA-carboxylase] ligase [Actinomycetota bacterium]